MTLFIDKTGSSAASDFARYEPTLYGIVGSAVGL
jgi:hypothetical protein